MFVMWTADMNGRPSISKATEIPTNGSGKPIQTLRTVSVSAEIFALPLRELEKIYPLSQRGEL